jgi:SAM-dependent methyltransferase
MSRGLASETGSPDETSSEAAQPFDAAPAFDTSVAHSARVYDYWLGGKDNFAADRAAAEQVIEVRPAIRTDVRANRAFLGRAVRYLAGPAGMRQFLDIGTGLPSADNTHEVAQSVAPGARIVYVDNDPIVLAHARALLTSAPEGVTAYLDADLRDPESILARAGLTLDLTQPVAIMLVAVLHHVPDSDDPYRIVARLRDAVPSGSHLVISHPARDVQTEKVAEVARRYNASVVTGQTRRSVDEVTAFFDDWEILEPGVTQTPAWRPDPPAPVTGTVPMWAGVARKP